MNLRPYQQQGLDEALRRYSEGEQSVLAVMPTGVGKTVFAGAMAKHMLERGRIMVLCHRNELIEQAADKFHRITGEYVAIEKAERSVNERSMHAKDRIVVASVQTLNTPTHKTEDKHLPKDERRRRYMKFNPKEFAFLWIDEAHHLPSPSFLNPFKWFTEGNPDLRALAVTATPDRADQQNIMRFLNGVCADISLPQMIQWGYLVPIRQRLVNIKGLDFSSIKKSGDDLNEKQLEDLMKQERTMHGCIHATLETAMGLEREFLAPWIDLELDQIRDRMSNLRREHPMKSVLCFSPGVEHSKRISEIFNRWMPNSARHIDGTTDPSERRQLIEQYAKGKYPILTNCGVFLEGFDCDRVQVISMMRPTTSRPLYAQAIGRGTRPLNSIAGSIGSLATDEDRRQAITQSDKPYLDVLDFTGNSGKHKLVCSIDLTTEIDDEAIYNEVKRLLAERDISTDKAIDEATANVEQQRELDRVKDELEDEEMREELERQQEYVVKARMGLLATASYSTIEINPFGDHRPRLAQVPSSAAYKPKDILTDKQAKMLKGFGIGEKRASELSPKQASAIIAKCKKSQCTKAQAWRLRQMGYRDTEIAKINFDRASQIIGQHNRNKSEAHV